MRSGEARPGQGRRQLFFRFGPQRARHVGILGRLAGRGHLRIGVGGEVGGRGVKGARWQRSDRCIHTLQAQRRRTKANTRRAGGPLPALPGRSTPTPTHKRKQKKKEKKRSAPCSLPGTRRSAPPAPLRRGAGARGQKNHAAEAGQGRQGRGARAPPLPGPLLYRADAALPRQRPPCRLSRLPARPRPPAVAA